MLKFLTAIALTFRRMHSPAYRDFLVRASEATLLARAAAAADSPDRASALAKGSAVLIAAALERYINDFLRALCLRINQSSWDELSEGQQQYMAYQIASRVRVSSARLVRKESRDTSPRARARLRRTVEDAMAAFADPSSWQYHRTYGMFMDGAAEPDRIDGVFGSFLQGDVGFFDVIASRGRDRGAIATAIAGMIEARHGVAHADATVSIGPDDVRLWLRLTRLLVRETEAILWSASAG